MRLTNNADKSRRSALLAGCVAGAAVALTLGNQHPSQAQTYTLTTIASFNRVNGDLPANSVPVTFDGAGNMWGTTYDGATNDLGNVWEIPAGTSNLTDYYDFTGTTQTGQYPEYGVFIDGHGNILTAQGQGDSGSQVSGDLFEINNSGTLAAPVYAPNNAPATVFPRFYAPTSGMVSDSSGNLYLCASGGSINYGSIVEIVNNGTVANPVYASAPTTIGSFLVSNGYLPSATLSIDSNGNLFGQCAYGGANNNGTVFEVQNTGTRAIPAFANGVTALVNLSYGRGTGLYTGVTIDGQGNLFGVAAADSNNDGEIYEVKNTGTLAAPIYGNALTSLAVVPAESNSTYPMGDTLLLDSAGDLFGTLGSNPNFVGSVFELTNGAGGYSSAITTLGTFSGANSGRYASSPLTMDSSGDLFGTTVQGGADGLGTVYELVRGGSSGTAPEPGALALLLPGLVPLGLAARRRRRA